MLQPYITIWDWDWIFGHAGKAIFSLGIRSPWLQLSWLSGSKIDVEVIKKCNLSHAFFFWFLIGIALTDIDSHGLLIQLSHPKQPTPSQVALRALMHCVMKLILCGHFNPTNPRTNPWNFGGNCSAFGGGWKTQFFSRPFWKKKIAKTNCSLRFFFFQNGQLKKTEFFNHHQKLSNFHQNFTDWFLG